MKNNKITQNQIIEMEIKVLDILEFNLNMPTVFQFV